MKYGALYHLSVHSVSRLGGGSVLAAAAYRRAELFDTRSVTAAAAYQRAQKFGNDGKVFDYRKKIGVEWAGILAPDHAPEWVYDAQTLWRRVEEVETRANARFAREMTLALPHGVALEDHIAMVKEFVGRHLVAMGMIADMAIHAPPVHTGGDPRNWHAHVLLTDRPITPEGFAPRKDRSWNARENLLRWRKGWAEVHNRHMERLGLPGRIDHRSLHQQRDDALARGDEEAGLELDRLPQIHVGKGYHAKQRRTAGASRRLKRLDGILAYNAGKSRALRDAHSLAIAETDVRVHEATRRAVDEKQSQTLSSPTPVRQSGVSSVPPHLLPPPQPLPSPGLLSRSNSRQIIVPKLNDDAPFSLDETLRGPVIIESVLPSIELGIPGPSRSPPPTPARAPPTTKHTPYAPPATFADESVVHVSSAAPQTERPQRWFDVSAVDIALAFYKLGVADVDDLRGTIAEDKQLRVVRSQAIADRQPSAFDILPSPTLEVQALARLRKLRVVLHRIHTKRLAQHAAFLSRTHQHAHARNRASLRKSGGRRQHVVHHA